MTLQRKRKSSVLGTSMVVRCVFPRARVSAVLLFIFLILLISNAPEICSVQLPTFLVKLRTPLVETIASANVLFISCSVELVRHLGCSFSYPRRRAYYLSSVKYYLELSLAFDYPGLFWRVMFILILAIMLRLQLRQIQTDQDQDVGFLARKVRNQRGVIKRVFFAISVTFGFTFVV